MTENFTKEEFAEARKSVARSEAAIGKDFDKMSEEEFNNSLGPYLWPRAPQWPNDSKIKVSADDFDCLFSF